MKTMRWLCPGVSVLVTLLVVSSSTGEDPFSAAKAGDVRLSDVRIGAVKPLAAYDLPFLTWGGDVATFVANGGDKLTRKGTLFDQQGLKLNLVNGDDFLAQVRNYLEGKTPFLRGTMSQLGQASEVLGKEERTRPIVFLQLTWSAGDHMVARSHVKTLNDLKGKTVALQWGGPHVGMLNDVLRSAGLDWKDVKVKWMDNVTAVKDQPDRDPAAYFSKHAEVDACFVITPDMLVLTSGGKEGTGAEGSVKGAKILVSTQTLSHSIADVYACRKDFYDANKPMIEKIAAGYLKACEELVEMRNNQDARDKDRALAAKYKVVLKMTQDIYGKEAIPDEDAAHGLILDASFVGLTGNYTFFKDENNPVNFQNRQKAAVDMAVAQGYAPKRFDLVAADLDYPQVKKLGQLKLDVKPAKRDAEKFDDVDLQKDDTVYSFTVQFPEGGGNLSEEEWKTFEPQFQKAIADSRLYGNAKIVVRGHVDPTKTLGQFVAAGLRNGTLRRTKVGDEFKYFVVKTGMPLDLADTKKVLDLLRTDDFLDKEDPERNPRVTLEAAQKLSEERATNVRKRILALAESRGVKLNESQFKSEGIGIAEPVIGKPKNAEQAAYNRRVEFRIVKISPEKLTKKDFDF